MSEMMKAVRFHEYGGSDKLVIETIPRPEPKANEILVKVHYAGVNPADWKIREGYMKDYLPLDLPAVAGIDFSGTVAEVGSEVRELKPGEAVFGAASATYAEYVAVPESEVTRKPASISHTVAATVPVGALTAWKMVADSGVKSGQTVVVQGAAGGVGLFAVQFALLKGAAVIGVASSANIDFVKSLGAERVVDYTKGAVASEVREADVVLDTVGGSVLESSYGLLRKDGVLATIAGSPSEEKAKEHQIKALRSGRDEAKSLAAIAKLLEEKSIFAEVGQVFPFAEVRSAQEMCQTGHGRGRILLKVVEQLRAVDTGWRRS